MLLSLLDKKIDLKQLVLKRQSKMSQQYFNQKQNNCKNFTKKRKNQKKQDFKIN